MMESTQAVVQVGFEREFGYFRSQFSEGSEPKQQANFSEAKEKQWLLKSSLQVTRHKNDALFKIF